MHFLSSNATSAESYVILMAETIAVLAVMAAAAWAFVRFVGPRMSFRPKGSRMRHLERLALEPRRSVHLVRVDDKTLVIGMSEHSICLLDTIADNAGGDGGNEAARVSPPSASGEGK